MVLPAPDLDRPVIEWLRAKDAEGVPHLHGTLLAHLEGTAALLRSWGASHDVVNVGLCHATYGTAGFDPSLLPLDQRAQLAALIGAAAEEAVYFYASCDRGVVYPQFGGTGTIRFRNRFTGEDLAPTDEQLRDFVEVTYANELEIIPQSQWPDSVRSTADLLTRMQSHASDAAIAAAEVTLTPLLASDDPEASGLFGRLRRRLG